MIPDLFNDTLSPASVTELLYKDVKLGILPWLKEEYIMREFEKKSAEEIGGHHCGEDGDIVHLQG
jgi:hypothetical protein